ncbi:MAG: hypothetical protein N2559_16855, partial [Anaerolineae bacterium]|nr:hypothetical protein [Anaerolineae bacterium]
MLRAAGMGTNVIPPGGIRPEEPVLAAINKTFGTQLSSRETYEPTYVGRALLDMFLKGEITKDEYDRALTQQSGAVWDKALNRIEATRGATNVVGFLTGLRPREMMASEQAIYDAQQARALLSEYIKNANPPPEELKELYKRFDEQYPFYGAYAVRYADPEKRAAQFENPRYLAELDKLKAERDAALAKLPVGMTGDQVTQIWDRYNEQVRQLTEKFPNIDFTSTRTLTPREQEQKLKEDTIRAVLATKPNYDDYKSYEEYARALADWQRRIPQLALQHSDRAVSLTLKDIEQYQRENDTVKQALDAAFNDWYHERINAMIRAQEGYETAAERRIVEKVIADQYGDKPSEADLLAQLRPHVDGLVIRDEKLKKGALFLPHVWEGIQKPEN